MGSSVGPSLAKALISALGNDGVAIQGVDYTASIASNVKMGSEGEAIVRDFTSFAAEDSQVVPSWLNLPPQR